MKNILIAFICILFAKNAAAQKDSLAIDENDKYIYYQTVSEPNLNADTLYNRALYFFKTGNAKDKLKLTTADKAQGVLAGNGGFLVSKKSFVTTHEDGEITYTMRIEVKDGKYRYWFTDFVYVPYQRNRYNIYEPVPGITIPLEKADGKLDKRDIAEFQNRILLNSRRVGGVLRAYMLKVSALPKAEKKLNKISTKEW
ncbi:DUF4468 domain-containing protein [Mucilaginibacter sabulilitoris]|uniref:DUF4468 domain-containing protein n=1 Tax=Mucilaginibacter sabulilitoris TaxID=1173583 RepID=A0ABZ0TSX1_9SPHI|nr:DUF4468 domain-containing protein [Mucilaginibacter sabulilitoris]WPU96208.1 DUF4468 domain-containing protein [Mucilaginibacter sabulilitoris]